VGQTQGFTNNLLPKGCKVSLERSVPLVSSRFVLLAGKHLLLEFYVSGVLELHLVLHIELVPPTRVSSLWCTLPQFRPKWGSVFSRTIHNHKWQALMAHGHRQPKKVATR
jgi:hypothetical protein